jgi:hypothetical protein
VGVLKDAHEILAASDPADALIAGTLLLLAESSTVTPFLYTLF